VALRFPPTARVLRKVDFEAIYRHGRRHGNSHFSLTVHPNELATARLGMAIAARTVGKAVSRNRLRRIIRESFRCVREDLPSVDIIVGARAAARDASASELRTSLERLWNKVLSRC
jgi:ribonuclease P protein component